ncbi:uncharacterized protein LOC127260496 [Andrographis paniculata]|uniref:uncharacterized protein LOC127260496 n=1 Tax=Andrographis paniculata TaxID=175694 RepID=UPI0021E7F6E2|nr:uncharacterized protein LOC127260496 [Andrographis paniculata]
MTDTSLLVWNVRGVGNPRAQREVHWLCKQHRIRILILLEPMVFADVAFFCRRFGFSQMLTNAVNSIWILADDSYKLEPISEIDQCLHVQVSSPQHRRPFFLSGIYARCSVTQRRALWSFLQDTAASSLGSPWLIGGDFNAIADISERKGPGRPKLRSIQDFSAAILDANLIDAGFEGSPHTWTNRRVWERLDRILYNTAWEDFAETTRVRHLPRMHSDHAPLLVRFSHERHRLASAFRFQNMWTRHHTFQDHVRQSWVVPTGTTGLLNLRLKLGRLKQALKWWNKQVFGNVFQVLAAAEKDAEECEAEFDRDPSDANLLRRQRSAAALTHAIALEEAYWKQKAACRWAVEGERNSRMFHSMVKERRRRATIFSMADGARTLTDHSDIKQSAITYFSGMLGQPDDADTSEMDALADPPPQVPPAECTRLLEPPTLAEIRAVVFSIDQDSAAGPMASLPPSTRNVGRSSGRMCLMLSKIFTKLLTTRLSPLLPQLLSPHQSGFVKGRAIADNILLASEMVHDLNLRGGSHNLLLKLDLNKAYDRVSWRFLRHALSRFGFPAHFITLIMNCVEHAWYSILVNGDLDLLSRGLERLYSRFPDLYYRCRGRFRLTHLAYADDVLIFANTCGNRISLLTDFLTTYARITGQKVNCQKSQLVFSRQCPENVQRQLQSVTGFGAAELPLTYLGAPLYVGNRRNILYEELLGKLRRYLQRWDRSVLSHGGRLQLIRSTLFSLPLYLLQVLCPPQAVLHSVEQLFARFFWGSYHGHRRRHWISWADIARPQEEVDLAFDAWPIRFGPSRLNCGGDSEMAPPFGLARFNRNIFGIHFQDLHPAGATTARFGSVSARFETRHRLRSLGIWGVGTASSGMIIGVEIVRSALTARTALRRYG